MFSPAGPERICKNMLYSIVGIGYHKNRAVSTWTCRGEASPSCCARPFCRLKAPLGLSLFRFAPQTRSYHFPLTIRPPTKMEEKIAAKNKRVIQIGLNTHSHDHEINPVTFSTAKIKTKATIGSILDRWDFFSVCITEPPWIPICWTKPSIPHPPRKEYPR